MIDILDKYQLCTLSGRPYLVEGDLGSIESREFLQFLGEVYATALVEAVGYATSGMDSAGAQRLFNEALDAVREVDFGGDVPYEEGLMPLAFAAWGLVKLDQLVSTLESEGVSYKAMQLFASVNDAHAEAWGGLAWKSERSSFAALGGRKKNERYVAARDFVASEWGQHRHAYCHNKSAFSRDYVKRVKNELDVNITEKQMREVWLSDTLTTSNPDGLPVDGE
ncbi:hypothetical protein [Polaromonas eurypsychrophila]|uniref:Uncharacterized protein n=1 Tax=Polaromonas eurypsychrophila TaxID=1614635 RepID=A0A916WE34_9BURK|nr:hypothetical protein [Polaromonas eurypsychrophila]GGA91060.1 hypothetical protein GCM10011496_09900 [Polaromonas eurypsychrophila]